VSLLTVARRCYIIRRVLYRYGPRISANTLRWFTRPRSRTSLVVNWPADIPAISCRSITFARYITTHWVPCSLQPGIHLLDLFLLVDRTYGRAYASVLRPFALSVCTECNVAKRCVLEQKLLLTAYRKSYMRDRLVLK